MLRPLSTQTEVFMTYEYTIKELDMDQIIEQLEQTEYSYEDDIQIDEILEDGNLWSADPAEIAEIISEYPALEKHIKI
ncbi:MAG: hypothetical protein ABJH28_10265 [Paraglaciecola sp.]|uniref:hypothetical protein n=1 Tax=Paraglaciecola sp. TaxID=1920173 RepID=UPI003266599A